MVFSKEKLVFLRDSLEEYLENFGEAAGVCFEIESINFDSNKANIKLSMFDAKDKEEAKRKEFEKYAFEYGLSSDDFEREIYLNGKKAKIIGINTRASKYPIEVLIGGNVFRTTEWAVRRAINL